MTDETPDGPYEVREAEGDGYAVGYEVGGDFHESVVEETKADAEEVCDLMNEIASDLEEEMAIDTDTE